MEKMHIMRSNIIVKEYVMCDMRVCVRMNAFIHTGYPKYAGLASEYNLIKFVKLFFQNWISL